MNEWFVAGFCATYCVPIDRNHGKLRRFTTTCSSVEMWLGEVRFVMSTLLKGAHSYCAKRPFTLRVDKRVSAHSTNGPLVQCERFLTELQLN